jgi:hypothetical protein
MSNSGGKAANWKQQAMIVAPSPANNYLYQQ